MDVGDIPDRHRNVQHFKSQCAAHFVSAHRDFKLARARRAGFGFREFQEFSDDEMSGRDNETGFHNKEVLLNCRARDMVKEIDALGLKNCESL